jgi:hypothetical protein
MVLMKKKRLRGWKPPRLCCSFESRVRQKPVQMDLFEKDWVYYEGRFYVVPKKEDVASCESFSV